MDTGQFLAGSMSAILAVLLALALYKLRRVHLMLYAVQKDSSEARRELENLFGQVQALLALERLLKLPLPLPPLRGWAGSPDMLLQLAERVLAGKPQVVLECSSGASTLVAARCCQLNGAGHVYSLEHDGVFADKTRTMLQRQGLADWATVVHAPLETGVDGATWYRDENLPAAAAGAELLVVDGPPAGGDSMVRYPALPRLRARLAPHFTLLLDDADRPGERLIVERWLKLDPGLQVEWLPCEKGLAVLGPKA